MDNSVHYRLKNWGIIQRNAMAAGGVPLQNPQGASWQSQIKKSDAWLDLDIPETPDENDATITQAAMVRCMINDMQAATILTKGYRDRWDIDSRAMKRARHKFWRYL